MILTKFSLASAAMLCGSLRLTGSFFGCCDDPPPPAPANQQHTEVQGVVDVGDIADKLDPGNKAIVVVGNVSFGAKAGASVTPEDGFELAARTEVSTGGMFVYVGPIVVAFNKTRFAGGVGPHPGGGSQENLTPPVPGRPLPLGMYRLWRSPAINTVVMTPETIQKIETDYQSLRFAFSLPFHSAQEFNDSAVTSFWVEALDPNGNNVMPHGARLVSTTPVVGEWPILSTMLWPTSSHPVLSISLDVVNDDGSIVTPTQLGCDQREVTFRIGMSTKEPRANWDFGWCAGLWRTETDVNHVGDGGLWLGWHAASFDALDPINQVPQIVQVTDLGGNPISSFARGDVIRMTVANGFVPPEIEMSVGGKTLPTLSIVPGSNPNESIYTVQIPTSTLVGPWSLFFRNLGATMESNPTLVPQLVAGFDYVPVTVQ